MADRSSTAAAAPAELVEYRKPSLARERFRHRYLLLLMLPGIAYFVIFRYVPIYGVILAFKEYDVYEGILFSPWVGLKHFPPPVRAARRGPRVLEHRGDQRASDRLRLSPCPSSWHCC